MNEPMTPEFWTPLHVAGAPGPVTMIRGTRLLPLFPKICGVYFLCRGNAVVYIGQSVDIMARVTHHAGRAPERKGGGRRMRFNRVYYVPLERSALSGIEGALIRALRPRHNKGAPLPSDDDWAMLGRMVVGHENEGAP